mmetsp:Transcript_38832/g.86771  ORF Transcript_38832/g.86771 Transcript_38832/m.86771 type:complete len:396 (+) Transcript_38832:71-1258(+)
MFIFRLSRASTFAALLTLFDSARATSKQEDDFARDGLLVIPGFATPEEVDGMMARMSELVGQWDPYSAKASVFRTDDNQESAQGSDAYFLESADKIHFFLEPGAMNEATGELSVPKHQALNKVGHGLHVVDLVFRAYAESPKVGALVRSLGWVDPVLPQSMFIFKQPKIGGEVTPHQDSTFLHTVPRLTCLGLWLALEDATAQNGCLWARPGSHKEPLRRVFKRNPSYFAGDFNLSDSVTAAADSAAPPMMVFEELEDVESGAAKAPFSVDAAGNVGELGRGAGGAAGAAGAPAEEGQRAAQGAAAAATPDAAAEQLRARGFVPLPVAAGTLVVLHGSLDHASLPNTSPTSRHTFQLHAIDGPGAGVKWSEGNWLQYEAGGAQGRRPFPALHRGQ